MSEEQRLSILGQLRARRESIKNSEHKTIRVPRWSDPEIFVRYAPLEHGQIRRAQSFVEKAPKQRKYQTEIDGNCDLLIRACVGVFAVLDGHEYSLNPDDPNGEHTRFDADLARNLGLEENATAREIVKALFITDGDIIGHASELVRWSGYRDAIADEDLEGE